ncbi:MAG: iron ABC transporter permease [Candidatus Cloacimonetes bacterium]|nr:iron ABC transporter permease [Candidatus Cloacimonadota bacterium]
MKKYFFIIPLLFLVLFFYIPLITILKESFFIDQRLSLANFIELIGSYYHRYVIFFTIKQAFISLIFTLLLGIPAAYIFTYYSFPGKNIIRPLFLIPFVLPSIIVALGFILLYGQNGYLNRFLGTFNFNIRILYRLEAIILAHSFYNFPIVLKFVSDAWQRVNKNYTAAAQTLGANKLRIFFRITLPSLLPSIINASVLVFIYCFMSFGIVLVLGSVRYTTVEVNIYILIYHLIRFPLGMALGSIQLLFSLIFLLLAIKSNQYYIKHLNLLNVISNDEGQICLFSFKQVDFKKLLGKLLSILYLLLLIVVIIGPMIAIVAFGISANLEVVTNFSNKLRSIFEYQQIIGSSVATAIINSVILAFSTALFSLILSLIMTHGIICLERNPKTSKFSGILEFFTIIPLVVSPVTFTLGYLRIIHFGDLNVNRLLLLISAHTIITLPFATRIIVQVVRNIPDSQFRAAKSLGANTFKTLFSVVIPQIRRGLFLALSFAFAISLGELGAVMMLGRNYVTIPMAIYRFIGARRLIPAVNMGILLLLVTFLFFFLIEKLSNTRKEKSIQ